MSGRLYHYHLLKQNYQPWNFQIDIGYMYNYGQIKDTYSMDPRSLRCCSKTDLMVNLEDLWLWDMFDFERLVNHNVIPTKRSNQQALVSITTFKYQGMLQLSNCNRLKYSNILLDFIMKVTYILSLAQEYKIAPQDGSLIALSINLKS